MTNKDISRNKKRKNSSEIHVFASQANNINSNNVSNSTDSKHQHQKKSTKSQSAYKVNQNRPRKKTSSKAKTSSPKKGVSTKNRKQPQKEIPSPKDNIRIIPLSGVEEIGKNTTVVEYKDDIVVIDCGIQFSEEDTPGIDFILPNTQYLEKRKNKIRGVFITHGHMDHIGGLPYTAHKIGNPPIYASYFTSLMINKNKNDFPGVQYDLREVEDGSRIKASENISVRFFSVTHTIPDAMGIVVETPEGNIVFTGDLKIDHKDGNPKQFEKERFGQFQNEDVLALVADSTNVEKPGFSLPEEQVHENIEKIIKDTKNRLIIATFSTQLERIIKIVEAAEKHNKKVAVDGRSMKENIEIAKQIGLIKYKKETFIPIEEINSYPPHRVIAIVTGSQGDEFAALMRISNKNHKHLKVGKQDTVLLSSSVIPGNERAVQKLKDNLSRLGAKIIHNQIADIHSSGHAYAEEMRWIHQQIAPRFFIPVHGYHYMLTVNTEIAKSTGIPAYRTMVPNNGMMMEMKHQGQKIQKLKQSAPSGVRMVDGLSIGEVQEVVIRDRKALAQDGMFVIIASIDLKTGRLRKSPDIISRGFIYLRESQELLRQSRLIIKKSIEGITTTMHPINFDYIKGQVSEELSKFLLQKTNKHPIIIPVVIGL